MNTKSTNITILLVVVAIAILVTMNFFGIGNMFAKNTSSSATETATTENPDQNNTMQNQTAAAAQAVLDEIKQTGTVSDLRVVPLVAGTGDAMVVGDTIQVDYTGSLPDGTVFDSSRGKTPLTLVIAPDGSLRTPEGGGLIAGWSKGLTGMKAGERRLLVIPPALGYGAQAIGPIPANSTLIFDVELVKIQHGN